ncbi:MFS transporter [Marinomonas sp. C2222]|uniref:MFS transporter n=1 Tax=Marinomonas sargassi TaxID=2984494 RepID=A0ABT2YQD0_9GAMM|nr:MFS transporter [Marinomonas sargassi]MCV2402093.1 MFS transporter [Marinomonas sargassi]
MNKLIRIMRHDAAYIALFIFFTALSLRGPVMGLSPLFERISLDLNLSSSQLGLLASLPLVAFAVFAPVSAQLIRRWSLERTLILGVSFIALGMLMRSLPFIQSLYFGMILIGVGIAVGNVLLPGLVKRYFPESVVQVTAIYVLMMNVGAFLMASTAIPLSQIAEQSEWPFASHGWSFALLCQVVIILLPIMIWLSGKIVAQPAQPTSTALKESAIWKSKLAWLMSGFLAMNSLLSYSVMAWIPAILMSNGYTDSTAGLYLGYVQVAGALPSLLLAPFINKLGSLRRLALISTGITWLSLFGYLYLADWSVFWSLSFGFSTSMSFILGMSFVSFRTESPKQAAALSGMSQLLGYSLAAVGPFSLGFLFDLYQSWQPALYLLLGLGTLWVILGWYASPPPTQKSA